MNVAFLVSGAGHLARRVLETLSGEERVRFVGVLGDGGGTQAVEWARGAGIPVAEVRRGPEGLEPFNRALYERLLPWEPDLLVCAFNHLLTEPILGRWEHRVINVHYGLLPAFPGFGAIRKAIAYGARFAGATVHLVDESVDLGAPILQGVTPIGPGEDEAGVHRRLFDLAVPMTAQAITWAAEGRLRVEMADGRPRVHVEGARYDGFPINPRPDRFEVAI